MGIVNDPEDAPTEEGWPSTHIYSLASNTKFKDSTARLRRLLFPRKRAEGRAGAAAVIEEARILGTAGLLPIAVGPGRAYDVYGLFFIAFTVSSIFVRLLWSLCMLGWQMLPEAAGADYYYAENQKRD